MMGLQAAASKRKLDDDLHAPPQAAKQGRLDETLSSSLVPDWRLNSSLNATTLHQDCTDPTKSLNISSEPANASKLDDWQHNSSVLATTLQDDDESDEEEDDDEEEEERGGRYLPAGRSYQCVRYHGDHYAQELKPAGYYGTNGEQSGYCGAASPQYTRQPHYPSQRSAPYWGGSEYYGQESVPQQTIRCDENGKSYLDLGSSRAYGSDVKCCDGTRTSWCSRGPGAACYRQRRLAVLNISMCKLGRYRQFPDPSLHRSVLICNTLRYIEREMEHEGFFFNNTTGTVQAPPAAVPPSPTALPSEPDQGYNGGQFSESSAYPMSPYRSTTPTEVALPSYEQNLRDLSSSGRATPFPQTTYDGDSGIGDEESTRGINWGSVLSLSSQSDLDPMNNNDLYPTSPNSSSTLGLDSNSLDMDLGNEFDHFLPGWKLTPLSADDIIKSVPASELSSRQPEGEIDSIMNVLVGT